MDLTLDVAGEPLVLLPERCAYWLRERTLLVADAHFGKAAAFRASGIPVPEDTTHETLARLDAALERHPARRIVFLGDLLHSRRGRAPGMLGAVGDWRGRHPALDLMLVRGNHDRHAGDPPAEWGVEVAAGPVREAPFAFSHRPEPLDAAYVLAGHLHPAHRLRGRAGDALRLPCFWFGAAVGVLPAFGSFTGGADFAPEPGDRICVIADACVVGARPG